MYKILISVALVACVAAEPGVVAPLAYANAPLYAAGGSQQVDVRNNYDGTLSSYTTAPFNYAPPYSSRYVSGIPAGPGAFAAPAPAALAAPARYSAPLPFAAPFASPFAAAAPYTAPLPASYAHAAASPFAAAGPFAAGPFAGPAPLAAAPSAYASPAYF